MGWSGCVCEAEVVSRKPETREAVELRNEQLHTVSIYALAAGLHGTKTTHSLSLPSTNTPISVTATEFFLTRHRGVSNGRTDGTRSLAPIDRNRRCLHKPCLIGTEGRGIGDDAVLMKTGHWNCLGLSTKMCLCWTLVTRWRQRLSTLDEVLATKPGKCLPCLISAARRKSWSIIRGKSTVSATGRNDTDACCPFR